MKALKYILTIIAMVVTVGTNAQQITPIQLKNTRLAVYDWLRDYEDALRMEGRNAKAKFLELFTDTSAMVANDIVSLPNFDFKKQTTSAAAYARLLTSDNNYNISFKVANATLKSERISGDKVLYEIDIEKTFSAKQKNANKGDRYEYPERSAKQTVSLECVFGDEQPKAKATAITAEPTAEFVVLHSPGSNTYKTDKALDDNAKKMNDTCHRPIIKYRYKKTERISDPKMRELQADTAKWAAFANAGIGLAAMGGLQNTKQSDLNTHAGLGWAFGGGIYRQVVLLGNIRIGADIGIELSGSSFKIEGDNTDRYNAVDPDGGPYERIVEVSNYSEKITRTAVGVPVAVRLDYFLPEKWQGYNLSVFAKVGCMPAYDVAQKANANFDVLYSGYYDWLFGLTIDQNGFYDFGRYSESGSATSTAIDKFSLAALASAGVSCWLNKNLQVDCALQYCGTILNKTLPTDNYHLTQTSADWQTATNMMSKASLHKVNFKIQFNYNF